MKGRNSRLPHPRKVWTCNGHDHASRAKEIIWMSDNSAICHVGGTFPCSKISVHDALCYITEREPTNKSNRNVSTSALRLWQLILVVHGRTVRLQNSDKACVGAPIIFSVVSVRKALGKSTKAGTVGFTQCDRTDLLFSVLTVAIALIFVRYRERHHTHENRTRVWKILGGD